MSGIAVIETGGKQYVVREGDVLVIEKIQKPSKSGSIVFDKVLLRSVDEKTEIGEPYIKGAKVSAEFVEEGRGKKVTVLKYKPKTRYRVKRGHRQSYTKVRVTALA